MNFRLDSSTSDTARAAVAAATSAAGTVARGATPGRATLIAGGLGSLLSTLVLARRGRVETGSHAAPLNAVSHWLYGDKALLINSANLRHTATGAVIHTVSATMWAWFYELLMRRRAQPTAAELIAGAAAVTAVAAAVDLKLVPERLTPGFERRLSQRSLVMTYAAFGAGLALGALWVSRQR